ncbi:MAG: hypothetical protein E7614_04910 [Ruminococcaceae bacterium]|nr:hypothetical protein [Oscillospiraceae bacterium]
MSDFKYENIINMNHHISNCHRPMMIKDRAAQFAPFAALTGYEDAVFEAGRKTVNKAELSEESICILNRKLESVLKHIDEKPEITVTFFCSDDKKEGGSYKKFCGKVKRVDEYKKEIVFHDDISILIENIYDLSGDFFERYVNFEY